MMKYVIVAQLKNEPKSKTYLVGWRGCLSNLIIERTYTERTVYFVNLRGANNWLIWAMKYLPGRYTYRIVDVEEHTEQIIKNLKSWTQPVWAKYIQEGPGPYILGLPFYFRKERNYERRNNGTKLS